MKKHFLLLLMAFMSISAWAVDDLTNDQTVLVSVANVGYGTAALNPASDIRITREGGEISNTYWEIEGYYEEIGGEKIATLAAVPVGETRYVKINFKGVFSGYKYGEFSVRPAQIVVTVKDDAYFTRTYRGDEPAAIVKADVEATLDGREILPANIDTYLAIDEEALEYECEVTASSPVGSYPITFNGISLVDDQNYELRIAEQNLTIEPAEINTEDGFTIAIAEATVANPGNAFEYNAETRTPAYTILWDNDDDVETEAIPLTFGQDFTVKFYNAAGTNEVANPTNVAEYTVKVFGAGNYTTADGEDEGTEQDGVAAPGFRITKAPLTVMPLPYEKNYDGNVLDHTKAQFSIAGRLGDDANKKVSGLDVTIAGNSANAGEYVVTATIADAKIGEGADQLNLSDNYEIDNSETVLWKINKIDLTINVHDVTMNSGDDEPNLGAIEAGFEVVGAIENDEETITGAYELAWANAPAQGEEGDPDYVAAEPLFGVADFTALPVGTIANAVKVTAEDQPILNNYNITINKGALTVIGTAFRIMPVVATSIEYGDEINISFHGVGGATFNEKTVEYEVVNNANPDTPVDITALPLPLGNYTVNITSDVQGTGDNAGATCTPLAGAFTIVKKHIDVTVKPGLTVKKNDPAADFIAGLSAADLEVSETVGDDVLEFEFTLSDAITTDENGRITNNAGEFENAILVALADNDVNANYEIGEPKGKLTISTAYAITLGGENTKADIVAAKANENEFDVTFTSRPMKAKEWYAMVLPFNTSAKELVNVLGTYVVVNKLSDKSTNQNFKFTLWMDEIPAGTPFIIKPAEALDWGEIIPEVPAVLYADVEEYNAAKDPDITAEQFAALDAAAKTKTAAIPAHPKYQFTGKEIVDVIDPYGADDIVYITGTYESGITLGPVGQNATDPDRVWWLSDTDQKDTNDWRKPKSNPHDLKPMEAYLVAEAGWTNYAPVITVEDFDGETTSIKTLNADKINNLQLGEGWYNLNGVKLQGAPTQKGVYINNGKKVIIK